MRRQAMDNIIQAEESVKLYEYEFLKPDLNDYIAHFNPNHDPANGQFTTGPGGFSLSSIGKRIKTSAKEGSVKRKRRKAAKKARITRARNQKIKTFDKQTKENIIKRKDIKSMLNNVDKFTNQEINDMLTRLDTERRLKDRVREYERAHMTTGQKLKEGFKESAKEGLARGGRQIVKTASANTLKWATKKVLTDIGGKDTQIGDQKWADIVNKLLKEEKK